MHITRVVAIILHAQPGPNAGPLERSFAAVRARNASTQAHGFASLGAETQIIETQPGGEPFGSRLRGFGAEHAGRGLVILGSGSIPLATRADRARFVAAAAGTNAEPGAGAAAAGTNADRARFVAAPGAGTNAEPGAAPADAAVLANNRFSADILAIPAGIDLDTVPDLAADNGIPRWLAGRGVPIDDLRRRWRLQVDLDSPIDGVLVGGRLAALPGDGVTHPRDRVNEALVRLRRIAADPAAELLVAGRTSSDALRWLERSTASRTRAFVEERGMKTAGPAQRPPRSSLGLLLDRAGPESLGELLATLADAAVVDTRVLMAHQFGRDEARWPVAEDRFASDLLLSDRIVDPWLRAVTVSVIGSSIPILLGGHTLVGPGLRLALGESRP